MTRFLQMISVGLLSVLAGAACSSGGEPASSGSTGATGATASSTTGIGGGAPTTTGSHGTGGAGGTSGAGGTGGSGGEGDGYPAPHGAPPQVRAHGGPVLEAPVFIPVYFSNDGSGDKAALDAFLGKLGSTSYWAATTHEYGVGPATAAPAIDLAEAAPDAIDEPGVKAWLKGKLESEDPAFGPLPLDAVYVLFYPASTVITLAGSQSCKAFAGYHTSVTINEASGGNRVAFAVMPRCDNLYGLQGLETLTGMTSHELIEAATNPYGLTTPAYATLTDDLKYWQNIVGGGEVADLCTPFQGMFPTLPEIGHAVQRSWSNAAALAGHDPCVPAPTGAVYFNAAPVMDDHFKASVQGQLTTVRGVKIPVGGSRVVDVELFSDASMEGLFAVDVVDAATIFGGVPHLAISLDAKSGKNGQTLHATIEVLSAGPDKTEPFVVITKHAGHTHSWFGLVGSGG